MLFLNVRKQKRFILFKIYLNKKKNKQVGGLKITEDSYTTLNSIYLNENYFCYILI